jgi:hypothetical protein
MLVSSFANCACTVCSPLVAPGCGTLWVDNDTSTYVASSWTDTEVMFIMPDPDHAVSVQVCLIGSVLLSKYDLYHVLCRVD